MERLGGISERSQRLNAVRGGLLWHGLILRERFTGGTGSKPTEVSMLERPAPPRLCPPPRGPRPRAAEIPSPARLEGTVVLRTEATPAFLVRTGWAHADVGAALAAMLADAAKQWMWGTVAPLVFKLG
jgi:hypothetical protein